MIAVDWKGDIYPCLRYMESSLGTEVPPLIIGNVYDGIMTKQCEQDCVHCLRSITRRSQSTDECFYCPIAEGCSWCSAFNY
jgi:radical SAM protein with 4Fe4S-binding SPASM domain